MKPDAATILIVDDEPLMREMLLFSFEGTGFRSLCASNKFEAFETVRSKALNVVLSDIRMPGGSGMDLLAEIKNHNAQRPHVFLMTGFCDFSGELFINAFDLGAEAIFLKPFDINEVIRVIEDCLIPREELWRRSSERLDTHLTVEVMSGSLPSLSSKRMVNIGKGGMFIAWEENFPSVGEAVRFRVTFDQERLYPLEGTGVVRWVRDYEDIKEGAVFPKGIGLEFYSMDEYNRSRVLALVNSVKTKAYIPKA
jgi:CheY-like chemotaxis protein